MCSDDNKKLDINDLMANTERALSSISPVHPLGHSHLDLLRVSRVQTPLLAQGLLG